MKNNSDMVQMVVLGIFGLGIAIGVLFFSGKISLPGDTKNQTGLVGNVTVWGVMPYGFMNSLLDSIEQQNKDLKITYVEKRPETIQSDLVHALSIGRGPDVFMMAPGQVAENVERLYIIPYTTYPDSVYMNSFIDPATEFMTSQGILAVPLFIDPMVLFYNRDLLSNEYLIDPPTTWNMFHDYVRKLTKSDDAGRIVQSAAPLGTTNNTSYTKDIVILKALQDGEKFVSFDKNLNGWTSSVGDSNILSNAMAWFLQFSQSSSDLYTWNTSLIKDQDMFTAGRLAMYFGYPNEYETIRKKNPNLNFAMAAIPQSDAPNARKTNYGKVYSIGVSAISKNIPAALGVMDLLSTNDYVSAMIDGTYYAPARRDMLNNRPQDNANLSMVYNSTIISKSFFDPDSRETGRMISTVIDNVNAGNKNLEEGMATFISGFLDLTSDVYLPSSQ